MKWLRLFVSYGDHFEGVNFPQLHDDDAEALSCALETVFTFYEGDNVEITYPETGVKRNVLVYTEESDGWSDDRYDFELYLKLRKRFEQNCNDDHADLEGYNDKLSF